MFHKAIFLVITFFSLQFSFAQETQKELPSADSSVVIKTKKEKKSPYDYSQQNPKRATIYSALLPGLGQAYNRRYWKIPIIYFAGGLFAYWTVENSKIYDEYNRGLNIVQDASNDYDSWEIDGVELYESQLKQGNDQYKRQRNFNFLLVLAVYGLQIVDANVDAHLLKFHNTDNFLSFSPTVINHRNNYSPGLALTFNLK